MRDARQPLFENTPPAIFARFLLGAVLGLFLGALLLALLTYCSSWALAPAVVYVILFGVVPLICGIAGIFGLEFLADLVSQLYEGFLSWG